MIRIHYTDDAGQMRSIVVLDIDVTHESAAAPTDHPVEDGSDVTDHVRPELDSFTATCFVSDSLLEAAESQMGGATETTRQVKLSRGGSMSVVAFSSKPNRAQLVFDELRALQRSRQTCTIVTTRRRYESMIIRRLSFPEKNTDGLEFQMEVREVRIATSRTVAVPRPRHVRGNRTSNAGRQQTQAAPTTPTPPASAPNRSAAAAALDSFFG